MRYILLGLLLGLLPHLTHQDHQDHRPDGAHYSACYRAQHDQEEHLERPQDFLTKAERPAYWGDLMAQMAKDLAGVTPMDLRVGYATIPGGYLGITFQFDEERVGIVLDPAKIANFEQAWEILLHEFAHAAIWYAPQTDPHGPLWGVTYARLYRQAIDPGPEEAEKED